VSGEICPAQIKYLLSWLEMGSQDGIITLPVNPFLMGFT